MNKTSQLESGLRSHYNIDEWFHHNRQQYDMLENRGVHSERVIQQSSLIQGKTKESVIRKKSETEWRIQERIQEIDFQRLELEKVRKLVQNELEAMELLQERIQDETKYVKTNAGEIVDKCIRFREGRTGIDLIHDEVEKELEIERKKIREAEALLDKTLEQAKETKRDLRASLYLLNKDVENKLNCLAIEVECLNLRETHTDLRVQQDGKILDNANISLPEWSRYSEEIMKSSEKKIKNARSFEAHVKILLGEIIVDLREQCYRVNETFNRRIVEVKEAKARLESHHVEIVHQINYMTQNIADLKKSIEDKTGFLALAQTRLEKRMNRPGIELVKDEVEASLVKEILEIKDSVSQLQWMHSEAEKSLQYLLKAQIKLEEEINVKTNSIKIDDVDCMSIRQSINYHCF